MTQLIKNQLGLFAIMILGFAMLLPQVAEAKRFGGGGSFGKQHSVPSQPRQAPAQQQRQQQAAPAQQQQQAGGASRFMGPLAGLAAGGLLAWMFFGDGFEGIQFMDILLFGLLAFGLFMLFRAWRNSQQSAYSASQPATASRPSHHQPQAQNFEARKNMGVSSEASATQARQGPSLIGSALSVQAEHHVDAPEWFDGARFVEDAKQHFESVQQAWDRGDASELEAYCTPALFNQLQALMQEIVVGENHTEVDTLHAEIVDQSFEDDYFIVSIRFSGFIKESLDEPAHAFNEIWHIRRLSEGEGNWQIAGIQQANEQLNEQVNQTNGWV